MFRAGKPFSTNITFHPPIHPCFVLPLLSQLQLQQHFGVSLLLPHNLVPDILSVQKSFCLPQNPFTPSNNQGQAEKN